MNIKDKEGKIALVHAPQGKFGEKRKQIEDVWRDVEKKLKKRQTQTKSKKPAQVTPSDRSRRAEDLLTIVSDIVTVMEIEKQLLVNKLRAADIIKIFSVSFYQYFQLDNDKEDSVDVSLVMMIFKKAFFGKSFAHVCSSHKSVVPFLRANSKHFTIEKIGKRMLIKMTPMAVEQAKDFLPEIQLKKEKLDKHLKKEQAAAAAKAKKAEEPEADESEDEEANMCKICYENPIEMAIIPCGHTLLCERCATNKLLTCPICRVAVEGIMKIFKC
eukprot:TRINITY_DN14179_c0_g1_i1.p1 TRINITY_DN14179_c0_g1~~TRINITY_DN14179_c0_g1_i1.p1  ORF type:complete len:301 (-),score=65.47 TRINITY_DN14179_c0_g1_i1:84-896(-)